MDLLAFTRPWWEWAIFGVAALIILLVALFFLVIVWEDLKEKLGRDRGTAYEVPKEDPLVFPYYVDRDGLRALANSLKIEIPLTREVTKSRRLSALFKGVGGEAGRSETAQYAGEVDFNRLAEFLTSQQVGTRVGQYLAAQPYVSDREVLAEAVTTIEQHVVAEDSAAKEALQLIQQTYDAERTDTVVKLKREELRQAALSNQLIVLSGDFERAGDEDSRLRLTRFEVLPDYSFYESWSPEHKYRVMGQAGEQLRVPEGVGIEVVLPDESAFTPSGKERIGRGKPFYGRVIGHSPSFAAETGILMCSAYAVWGATRTEFAYYP
jgi:hypothetical protein